MLEIVFVLLSAFCLLPAVFCQTPDSLETVRVDIDLVNLTASVFNRDLSRPSVLLQQKEFAVYENGVPQQITFFASAEAPFDLVLLLDLSGSTADKIGLIRKSSKSFVDAARAGDRIAVVTFTDQVKVVSQLTADRDALKQGISAIKKPRGGTKFWDALGFVLENVLAQSRAEHRRSAVVVMTDGVDNALPDVFGDGSRTSFEELIQIMRRSETMVLPIYLDTEKEMVELRQATPATYLIARRQLAALAAESGNVVYRARKVKDLEGVYEGVIRDLGTVYSIGYRPGNRRRDGSWREIDLQLIGHPGLIVRAKRGYFAK